MKLLTLLLAAAGAATPLAAQHDHPPAGRPDSQARKPMGEMPMGGMHMGPMQMGGMQMGDMPMHRAMMFAPAHLLERRDKLALSAQQVTRLEVLRDAARAAHDRSATAAKLAGDSLNRALAAAAPDTALARRLFRAHHDAMGEAHWVMMRTAAQAKAVLTDAQRGRVEGWADAMHEGPH